MKRKLLSLFLIAFVFCFIGIINSKAVASDFENGKTFFLPYVNSSTTTDLLFTGGYYSARYYTATGESGTTYEAYCLDPAGVGYSGSFSVIELKNEILHAAYETILSSNESYNVKRTALVTFLYGVARFAEIDKELFLVDSFYNWQSGNGGIGYASAFVNTGIEWACQNESYTSTLIDYSGDCTAALTEMAINEYSYYYPNYGAFSGATAERARVLFAEALQAAVAAKNGEYSSTESGMTASGRISEVIIGEDTVTITAIINAQNMSSTDYVNDVTFDCPTCSQYGLNLSSIEYSVAGGSRQEIENGSSTNIASSLIENLGEEELANGTLVLTITLDKSQDLDEETCTNIPFTINYDYPGSSKVSISIVVGRKDGYVSYQNYLISTPANDQTGPNTVTLESEIPCDERLVCETSISIPICSDEEDEAISEITAPEEIKKCILDSEDDAGNSYQLTENNGGVDNDYCQVFCKEDYRDVIEDGKPGGIKLNPVINDVNCGGYFQLTAHIEGKKDCYTGGTGADDSIDREAFIEDIIEYQEIMIQNQDTYLKAQAALNNIQSEVVGECGCVNYYSVGTYQGVESVISDENSGYVTTTPVTRSYSYSSNCSGCQTVLEEDEYVCPDTCVAGSEQAVINQIEAEMQTALANMEQAYEDYAEIIREYNACTANWMTEFPFEQRLKFYYSEYRYNTEYTTYYDLISAAQNEDAYYLEAQSDTLLEESEVEICKTTINEYYECESDPVVFDGSMELTIDEMNVIQEYGDDVYSTLEFTVCDSNGCSIRQQQISDATFIRKTVAKSQDYISPTTFYQVEANGRITVNSGYVGNAVTLDALINSLPISTNATGGGIFKLLLEDLGEFYDTGELGRLIDFEGDNETSSVAYAIGNNGIETFDGEYTCYYYSPCRPDDCPNCDFICEDEECHWVDCPDCTFECVNCIFNLNELQLNFKPISSTNVNSADREPGYNWLTEEDFTNWSITTDFAPLELLTSKAELTIEEIEEANETIYDKTGEDSELDFSIRVNSEIINYLKEYNDSVENEGGYANDSLTCYAATIDGKEYANIFCYSEVIDYLVENYDDRITVYNRTSVGSRSDDDNAANANGYWELWADWSEPLRNDNNGQYSVIGGPSWK